MKQKIYNRIVCIFNIIIWIFTFVIGRMLLESVTERNVLLLGASKEIVMLDVILTVIWAVALIANLILLIFNVKNKKILLWAIIPIAYFAESVLYHFKIEILPDDILSKVFIIIPIIYLILELKNEKERKNIIFYTGAIIVYLISMIKGEYTFGEWLVLSSGIIFCFSKDCEDYDSKVKKIINIISSAILIFITIFVCIKSITLMGTVEASANEAETIVNMIKTEINKEKTNNQKLIIAKRDNKWGYINEKGKEVIPCEYDAISLYFDNSTNSETNSLIARKDNTYYVLSLSGRVILEREKTPLPNVTIEHMQEMKDMDERIALWMLENLFIEQFIRTKTNEIGLLSEDDKNVLKLNNSEEFYKYKYELGNGFVLEIEQDEDNPNKCNMQITKNGQIISEVENVETTLPSEVKENPYTDKDGTLQTYSNGDIPFVDIEKQIHGFYNLKNMQPLIISGKYRILDIIDNKLILRDYNDLNYIKDYIMNMETGEILLTAEEISAYKDGFVINNNGKITYLDSNLVTKIEDGYAIFPLEEDSRVMLVVKENNGEKEYNLYDFDGNRLTTQNYEMIFFNCTGYIGKEYLLEEEYENYYNIEEDEDNEEDSSNLDYED